MLDRRAEADALRNRAPWLALLVAGGLLAWWWSWTPARPASQSAAPSAASPSATDAESRTDLAGGESVPFHRVPLQERDDAPAEEIGGRVVDASTGEPIASATVSWTADGPTASTRTSSDGVYRLVRPRDLEVLRFAARGFRSQERTGDAIPGSGRLAEVRLSPEETARVLVRWSGGEPVAGARVGASPRDWLFAPTVPDGGEAGAPGRRTDADGVVELALADPRPVYAIAPSGHMGTGLAVPGAETRIELVPGGARLELERRGTAAELDGSTLRLKRLDGSTGSGSISATVDRSLPGALVLSVGRWHVSVDEPFLIAEVRGDGHGPRPYPPAGFVELEVLPETQTLRIVVEAGWRLRLVRADTGGPVQGPFSYGKRHLTSDGTWLDGQWSRAVADASGTAILAPHFVDSDIGEGTSLRVSVPGYASAVIGPAELRAARADGDALTCGLTPLDTTELVITHLDGTPLAGSVWVRAVAGNDHRTVFLGRPDPGGSLGDLGIAAGEDIEVVSQRREPLATVLASDLRLGERNRILVPGGYGSIRITAVPPGAPSIAVVGSASGEHPPTAKGAELVFGPLLPGEHFVGLPALARAASSRAYGFGSSVGERDGAALRIQVRAGEDSSVPWQSRWGPGRDLEGHVRRTDGTSEGLIVVPLYSRQAGAARFGGNKRYVVVDPDGRYRVAADQVPPVALAVSSLDAYGRPVPLDVIEPGADATVLACALRLRWSGPVPDGGGTVTCAVDTAGFRLPLVQRRPDYRSAWHPSRPLLLEDLPCGTVELAIHAGDRWIHRTVSLAQNPGGITEVEVGP